MPHDPDGNYKSQQSNVNGDLYTQRRGNTKWAFLRAAAVAADTGYILVDLSDSTNYPHTATGRIRLYSLTLDLEFNTDGTGTGTLMIGVVTEVDGTNGSVDWFWARDFNLLVDEHYDKQLQFPNGMDLEVDVSGETSDNLITATVDSGQTTWQTDVILTSPLTGGGVSGQGDLVVFWNEVADGATINISILAEYITEAAT